MTTPLDYWVLREPQITEFEWAGFLDARCDFEICDSLDGVLPEKNTQKLSFGGLVLWLAHSSGAPVPAAYTNRGVHILAGGEDGAQLANLIAEHFGGSVHET